MYMRSGMKSDRSSGSSPTSRLRLPYWKDMLVCMVRNGRPRASVCVLCSVVARTQKDGIDNFVAQEFEWEFNGILF